jgi:OmpA-OmpF porin, OOP family
MKKSIIKVKRLIKAGAFGVLAFFISTVSPAQVRGFSEVLSLDYDEHQPLVSPTGEIFFTVAFHPSNKGGVDDPGDIWFLPSKGDGETKNPMPMSPISTAYYDLLIGFIGPDTLLAYHENLNDEQVISKYQKAENGAWEWAENLFIPGFRVLGDHFSARLHPGGQVMVMSMNSFGTYGNEDIYISISSDGEWSRPLNLGPTINTYRQELSPFLSDDMEVLYFSSNAHGAGSGKRIFYSHRQGDDWSLWSKPLPLGLPELPGMDLYFIEDSETNTIYYTNTQTSDGYGNILKVEGLSLSPLNAALLEESRFDQEEGGLVRDKAFEYEMDELDSTDYAKDELDSTDDAKVPAITDATRRDSLAVILENLEAGSNLPLAFILFKRGSSELIDEASMDYIHQISKYFVDHPQIKVMVEGHTDAYGNPRLNKDLSLKRAAAIRDIMVDNGVDFERIQVSGWGGERPIASNRSPEGREKNRRVELVILEK